MPSLWHTDGMTAARDGYIARMGETVVIRGRPFRVTVHWARVGGRAVCVGLDLRGFDSKAERKRNITDAEPVDGTWGEITSPVVRGFKVAETVEMSRQNALLLGQWLAAFDDATPAQRVAGRRAARAMESKPERAKPGPRPLLDQAALAAVVVPAYQTGGRKPVEAVRQALERHRGERVTTEQARKAVGRARRQGLLSAYERGAK